MTNEYIIPIEEQEQRFEEFADELINEMQLSPLVKLTAMQLRTQMSNAIVTEQGRQIVLHIAKRLAGIYGYECVLVPECFRQVNEAKGIEAEEDGE